MFIFSMPWPMRTRAWYSYCKNTTNWILSQITLLPRDVMLARYMLSFCVCPTVCPSICSSQAGTVYTKTAKQYHENSTVRYTRVQGLLVFWRQRSQRNSNRVTPTGTPN